MKAMLVYYSQTGNTEKVAKMLAKKIENNDIDLKAVSIERNQEKSFDENLENAKKEKKAKIEPVKTDLSEYDILFIGTPVWGGKPAPPINAFMEKCEGLEHVDIAPFLTHGGGGPGMVFEEMKNKLSPKGGKFVEKLALNSVEVDGEAGKEKIRKFIARVL